MFIVSNGHLQWIRWGVHWVHYYSLCKSVLSTEHTPHGGSILCNVHYGDWRCMSIVHIVHKVSTLFNGAYVHKVCPIFGLFFCQLYPNDIHCAHSIKLMSRDCTCIVSVIIDPKDVVDVFWTYPMCPLVPLNTIIIIFTVDTLDNSNIY